MTANPNWQTPADIVERARHVLGGIDLDPASDAEAQKTVRARRYITREENALAAGVNWAPDAPVSIFLNPPGGRGNVPGRFWRRLLGIRARDVMGLKHAIFLAFSLEQLRTTQTGSSDMIHFPLCIPRKRIAFVAPNGGKKSAPRYANAVIYVPGTIDRREVFAETFGPLGAVRL